MEYVEFNNSVQSDSSVPRIGGKSFISRELWPKDEEGNFMTLILSLPSDLVSKRLNQKLRPDTFISVFSTYSQNKDDYFLDKVIFNTDDKEEFEIIKNNTKVIFHKKEIPLNLSRYEIPAYEIKHSSGKDMETFFNVEPKFIQDEIFFDNATFFMQFYSGNFPEKYKNILYISDAIGYLFINNYLELDTSAGIYFGQST